LKRIFYLSGGASQWGVGHLMRSIELVSVLRNRGLDVYSVALIPNNMDTKKLKRVASLYDCCIENLDDIPMAEVNGIVIDMHTETQPAILGWLETRKTPAFALDWYHDFGEADLAVANLRGGASSLKYSIIRSEFQDAYEKRFEFTYRPDAVVVVGGRDPRGHLRRIARIIGEDNRFSNKEIVIVLGPLVEEGYEKRMVPFGEHVTVLRNPGNIAKIMAGAVVGVTNGGTSLMEFTMLGVPAIILPQSKEEDAFIHPFLEQGCGVLGSSKDQEFAGQLCELWENETLRQKRSEMARGLIDGLGAHRIADLIVDHIFRLREGK